MVCRRGGDVIDKWKDLTPAEQSDAHSITARFTRR
jgi:hypothetical protein